MKHSINQVIHDRYQIRSLLGRQIGRRTFLATDLETQTAVVLKILLFGPDFTWADFKLFEREAATLKTLDHAAIPRYLDSFDIETAQGKGFALIQSYIKARSLQAWAEAGRTFSEAELKAIATQLLQVLAYLHSRQPSVIHRDIKPSNILLGDRSGNSPGQIYLVDFGSVQTTSHPGTITVVGTYGYMPPEQFGGRTTPASDLYSLAATLIYLLTRIHPADLPRRRGQLQFDARSQVSDRFQAWLQNLVHPDGEHRPSTAQWALKTLQNEQLPLQTSSVLHAKPAGSKILLTKTETQLHVTIPALSGQKKQEAIFNTAIATVVLSLPLLFFYTTPLIGWLIMLLIGWSIFRIWANTVKAAFEEIQVFFDSQNITYATRGWLRPSRRHSSSIQTVSRLEISQASHIFGDILKNSTLNIWAGNQCYALSPQSLLGTLQRLTQPEIDWLAFEFSDWLDLPLIAPAENSQTAAPASESPQLSAELAKTKHQRDPATSSKEDVAAAKNLAEPRLTSSSRIPSVKRPDGAKCLITKTPDYLEISAPAPPNEWLPVIIMFSIFILFVLFYISVFIGLSVTAILIYLVEPRKRFSGSKVNPFRNSKRILLRVNSRTVSLWEKSNLEVCLNQVPTTSILRIQVIYKSALTEASSYHVRLAMSLNPSIYRPEDKILVGNRQFWLSQQEAYWLADELGTCLGVPVTELEIVERKK